MGTPERVHRMYTELTAGYHVDPDRLINGAIFDVDYSEMVVVKDIPFYSLCEHHLLPFFGTAAVAYIPRGRVIGLSKIPRVVEMYARRLQVQERLTQQIAEFLQDAARAAGRRRRDGGDPPVRGHARRPQAGHDHDDLGRPGAVPVARPDARRVLRPPRPGGAGRLTLLRPFAGRHRAPPRPAARPRRLAVSASGPASPRKLANDRRVSIRHTRSGRSSDLVHGRADNSVRCPPGEHLARISDESLMRAAHLPKTGRRREARAERRGARGERVAARRAAGTLRYGRPTTSIDFEPPTISRS